MRIETYSIDQLKNALLDDRLWKGQRIAISKNRALSAIHNPRANGKDVILAAAFDGNRIVGYHGALPDTMYIGNKPEPFAWGSCWWVDDELRGQRLGSLLKEKLIDRWENRFASRDVSPAALDSMKKSGLAKEFKKESGVDFSYNRSDVDSGLQQWDAQASLPNGYKIEYLSQLDAQASSFINHQHTHELVRRGARELNWASLYPWCSQEPQCELATLQHSYFFDLKYARFFNLFVKVVDARGDVVCLLMLLLCNQRLSAPYVYYDPHALELVCAVIGKHIIHLGIENFRTYNKHLITGMASMGPPAETQAMKQRTTLFSPAIYSLPAASSHLQDGDGDCVFWA